MEYFVVKNRNTESIELVMRTDPGGLRFLTLTGSWNFFSLELEEPFYVASPKYENIESLIEEESHKFPELLARLI